VIERRVDVSGGRPVVVRTANAGSARALEAIGARLRGAAHPGVVEVVSAAPTADGGWELRVAHAGTSLAAMQGLEPGRVAVIGAGVAATLVDLHDHGIVHGRLTARRVLVGSHDRPTLCGFGETSSEATPEDDVAALGTLLGELLVAESAPARQATAVSRRLQEVLDRATDPAPSRRPSMRQFARSLAEVAADARPSNGRMPARPAASAPRTGGRLGSTPQLFGVALAIAALAMVVGKLRTGSPTPATAAPATRAPSTTFASPTSSSSSMVARAVNTGPSCAVIEGRPSSPARACPHDVTIVDDIVTIDGADYRVGKPDDVVAVGSWRCAGDATVALLRPTTGAVYVFPAATDVSVTVEPVTTVPGGSTFEPVEVSPRCQELRVVDRSGNETALELRPT
jgi:hypothetical protein